MKKVNLKKHNYKGKLVVFEGADGSGKSTLVETFSNLLNQNGKSAVKVKMPSEVVKSSEIYKSYLNDLENSTRDKISFESLNIFILSDKLLNLEHQIISNLKAGKIVVCDRYCFSSYARCDSKIIRSLIGKFLMPDLVFLCHADKEVLKTRVKSREVEKDNFYDDELVIKEISNYEKLAKIYRFEKINTKQKNKAIIEQLEKIIMTEFV